MMKKAVLALAFLAITSTQALAASPEENGLILQQSSVSLGKQITVKIGVDWFQIEIPTQGYCVASKAPEWNVVFYRPDKKICKIIPFAEVSKKASLVGSIGAMSYTAELKLPAQYREVHRNGLIFYQYKLPGSQNEPIFLNEKMKRENVMIEYYTLTTLQTKLPRQGALLICRMHSLPATPGIPYSLLGLRTDHNFSASLATEKASTGKLKKPDFARISKYKKAEKLEQILYAQSPSDLYVDLIH